MLLEPRKKSYQVLVDDKRLRVEGPDAARHATDSGPAHAYEMPVRIPGRPPTSTQAGGSNSNKNHHHHPSSSYDAQAEDRLPVRLRGVKAAYGRALGTAGKLYLDKHASTIGGHPQSAAQAWDHLTKAAEVRKLSGGLTRRAGIYRCWGIDTT